MSVVLAAGGNGKLLWYLTRGTGAAALLLLTAAVVLGVVTSVGWRSRRVPRFMVSGLHRNVTLLATSFVVVHVVTTVVDRFAPIGYQDAVLPFLSPYRPVWLGLGAVAFDLLLALIATSLLRSRVGLRSWRVVHWFAYVSWPVALLHTLGTGSDARTSWLGTLGIVCTVAVVAAVLWRVAASARRPAWRVGSVGTAFVVPFAILVWALNGPLERGWARRAGTPTSLIASFRVTASKQGRVATPAKAVAPAPQLPSGSFDGNFSGRLKQTSGGNGLVVVTIEGSASGRFHGRVYVALRGQPLAGGGVQMIDSSVGLLPDGASAWVPGHVVGLEGQRILAEVRTAAGRRLRVTLALHISQSGSVTGSIRGTSTAGAGPSE